MNLQKVRLIGQKLINQNITNIRPLHKGRNSRIYLISVHKNIYILKFYRHSLKNKNFRLNNEVNSLKLFKDYGYFFVPKLINVDKKNNFIILEYIKGRVVKKYQFNDIKLIFEFVKSNLEIYHYYKNNKKINYATEACLNANAIIVQIKKRLVRFKKIMKNNSELEKFIKFEFIPTFEKIVVWSKNNYKKKKMNFYKNIDSSQLTLSPVDIGFHNCIKKNKSLYFIDFEYMGLDDPVKLVSDTILHPGNIINNSDNKKLLTMFKLLFRKDIFFKYRLKFLLPLFGLKWCMIILNIFLPEYYRNNKRIISKQIQLKKAKLINKKMMLMIS